MLLELIILFSPAITMYIFLKIILFASFAPVPSYCIYIPNIETMLSSTVKIFLYYYCAIQWICKGARHHSLCTTWKWCCHLFRINTLWKQLFHFDRHLKYIWICSFASMAIHGTQNTKAHKKMSWNMLLVTSKMMQKENGNDIIVYDATQLRENSTRENATHKTTRFRKEFVLLCWRIHLNCPNWAWCFF